MEKESQSIMLQVTPQDVEGGAVRLDQWLAGQLSDLSRSRIKQLAANGHVLVNGSVPKNLSVKLRAGMEVRVDVPQATPSELLPWDVALDILFEDEHMLVINKPVGMTVHPAAGHEQDTLVNALLAHCPESLSGIGGVERPGIVHRLDKDTSGLMVVAKHDVAHRFLSDQLRDRSLSRTYHALCWNVPKPAQGTIHAPIARHPKDRKKMAVVEGGRDSTTHYKVIKSFEGAALVRCKLETGRTHQIRVHMAHIHCPLIGDEVYGAKAQRRIEKVPAQACIAIGALQGQALHASGIGFIHPASKEAMSFECPMEITMQEMINTL